MPAAGFVGVTATVPAVAAVSDAVGLAVAAAPSPVLAPPSVPLGGVPLTAAPAANGWFCRRLLTHSWIFVPLLLAGTEEVWRQCVEAAWCPCTPCSTCSVTAGLQPRPPHCGASSNSLRWALERLSSPDGYGLPLLKRRCCNSLATGWLPSAELWLHCMSRSLGVTV